VVGSDKCVLTFSLLSYRYIGKRSFDSAPLNSVKYIYATNENKEAMISCEFIYSIFVEGK
jgi:hypothetical protein